MSSSYNDQFKYYIYAVFTTWGKKQSLPELKQYLTIYVEWLSRTTKLV